MTTKNKASEERLSELHGAVATVLCKQVLHTEQEVSIDKDGELVPTGEEVYTASPATLAAAIKFLKDNDITCDITQDENVGNLRATLAKKQKHSRLEPAAVAATSH